MGLVRSMVHFDWEYTRNNHQVHQVHKLKTRISCDLSGVSKILWLLNIESKTFHPSGNSSCFIFAKPFPHLCSTQYMDGSLSCAGGRL